VCASKREGILECVKERELEIEKEKRGKIEDISGAIYYFPS
jgi:hypothetical protein